MANEQFVSRYRKYGEEQPYWKAGIFKIRLPLSTTNGVPEMVQAVHVCDLPGRISRAARGPGRFCTV